MTDNIAVLIRESDLWRPYELLTPCTYCGLPADTVDHVIPQSLRYMLQEHGGWRDHYGRITDKVPACKECNSMAGSEVFPSLTAKRRYVHARIAKKYASVLRTANWTAAELDEMGPMMFGYVLASQELAAITRARLRWPAKRR